MRFRCVCLSSHRLIMDWSRKWPDLRSKMTWQTSHQVQPSLLHLHRHYSNDQCQLRRQWNAGEPEMNLIAVSARLQVIASFWKNKINFDKMAPEMQRLCPQHRIRISIISPIFQLGLISRSEKRPFSRCLPYLSPLAVATVTSRLQSCHELWLPLLPPVVLGPWTQRTRSGTGLGGKWNEYIYLMARQQKFESQYILELLLIIIVGTTYQIKYIKL